MKKENKNSSNKLTEKSPQCKNSPNGFHESQDKRKNTIPACIYCGKVI